MKAEVQRVEDDDTGEHHPSGRAVVHERADGEQEGQGQKRRAEVGDQMLVVRRVCGRPVMTEPGEGVEEVPRGEPVPTRPTRR